MNSEGVSKASAGFTLVEVLIVLAISGMIMALMFSGFRSVETGRQHIAIRNEQVAATGALRHFLQGLLSQCYPAVVVDSDGRQSVSFAGEPSTITFLGPLPERFGAADIVQYRLRATPNNSLALDWRFDRDYGNSVAAGLWTEFVLSRHLGPFSFTYFGSEASQDAPHWQVSWHRRDALPQLIDIQWKASSPQPSSGHVVVAPLVTANFCRSRDHIRCTT